MIVAYEHHQRHDLHGLSGLQRRRAAPVQQDRRGVRRLRRDDHHRARSAERSGPTRRSRCSCRAATRPTTPASPRRSWRCSASIRWARSSCSTTGRPPSSTASTTTTCCTRASRCSTDADGRWLETPEVLDLRLVDPTTGRPAPLDHRVRPGRRGRRRRRLAVPLGPSAGCSAALARSVARAGQRRAAAARPRPRASCVTAYSITDAPTSSMLPRRRLRAAKRAALSGNQVAERLDDDRPDREDPNPSASRRISRAPELPGEPKLRPQPPDQRQRR